MVLELIAALIGDIALQLLNPLVAKLDDITGLEADHMVMMRAIRQLENCRSTFENMPADETGLFELRQHTINGGKAEFLAAVEQ